MSFNKCKSSQSAPASKAVTFASSKAGPSLLKQLSVNGHMYNLSANMTQCHQMSVSNHTLHQMGGLADCVTNGSVFGSDIHPISAAPGVKIKVQGIVNHVISIESVGDVVTSTIGSAITVFQMGANHGKDPSIFSCAQMEWFGIDVNDKSTKVHGGLQCHNASNGIMIPLNVIDALPWLNVHLFQVKGHPCSTCCTISKQSHYSPAPRLDTLADNDPSLCIKTSFHLVVAFVPNCQHNFHGLFNMVTRVHSGVCVIAKPEAILNQVFPWTCMQELGHSQVQDDSQVQDEFIIGPTDKAVATGQCLEGPMLRKVLCSLGHTVWMLMSWHNPLKSPVLLDTIADDDPSIVATSTSNTSTLELCLVTEMKDVMPDDFQCLCLEVMGSNHMSIHLADCCHTTFAPIYPMLVSDGSATVTNAFSAKGNVGSQVKEAH